MPSAWTLGPLIIRNDIVLTIISLFLGVLVLFWFTPFSKKYQKGLLNEISSLGILFIVSLMISKALLNLDVFLRDPRAVISYPSNSQAFYLALVGVGLWILWKLIYHKQIQHLRDSAVAWMYIFFTALFAYQFIELVSGASSQPETLINLGWYGGLLALVVFKKGAMLLPVSIFILGILFLPQTIFFFSTDHVLGIGLLVYVLIIYFHFKIRRVNHV